MALVLAGARRDPAARAHSREARARRWHPAGAWYRPVPCCARPRGELARVRKAQREGRLERRSCGARGHGAPPGRRCCARTPVGQRDVERHAEPGEGQIVVGRGIRGKRVGGLCRRHPGTRNRTAQRPSAAAPKRSGTASARRSVFSRQRATAETASLDGTALDHALAEGQDVVKRLRLYQWQRIVPRSALYSPKP